MTALKRSIPLILAFVMGILSIVLMLSPHELAQFWISNITNWIIILGAFAFILGFYSLVSQHLSRVQRLSKGWMYSIFALLGITLMLVFGIINNGKFPFNSRVTTDSIASDVEFAYENKNLVEELNRLVDDFQKNGKVFQHRTIDAFVTIFHEEITRIEKAKIDQELALIERLDPVKANDPEERKKREATIISYQDLADRFKLDQKRDTTLLPRAGLDVVAQYLGTNSTEGYLNGIAYKKWNQYHFDQLVLKVYQQLVQIAVDHNGKIPELKKSEIAQQLGTWWASSVSYTEGDHDTRFIDKFATIAEKQALTVKSKEHIPLEDCTGEILQAFNSAMMGFYEIRVHKLIQQEILSRIEELHGYIDYYSNVGDDLDALKQELRTNPPYAHVDWLFDYIVVPSGATMFSILAFFIASAAYRSFRARNMAALLLLIAAVIVMLGRIPIGYAITDHIPQLSDWLLQVPNMAVKRAIFIGVALGAVATSLRIIFGIERTYLGGE